MKVYLDTPILVASMVESHIHHKSAFELMEAARARRVRACISTHDLAESFAVLTRAPYVPAIYPSDAWKMLCENVVPNCEVVALSAETYEQAIQACADGGWVGGRVYDALHIACARQAKCRRLYTYNVKHFQQMAPDLAARISAP